MRYPAGRYRRNSPWLERDAELTQALDDGRALAGVAHHGVTSLRQSASAIGLCSPPGLLVDDRRFQLDLLQLERLVDCRVLGPVAARERSHHGLRRQRRDLVFRRIAARRRSTDHAVRREAADFAAVETAEDRVEKVAHGLV